MKVKKMCRLSLILISNHEKANILHKKVMIITISLNARMRRKFHFGGMIAGGKESCVDV